MMPVMGQHLISDSEDRARRTKRLVSRPGKQRDRAPKPGPARIEAQCTPAFAREVKVFAAMRGVTVSALIVEAVRLYIGGTP